MEQLLEWMEIIEDVRQYRKVRHCIKDILIIVLFATLANADTWEQITDFALWNEDYLRQYIELKNGIPSHDTPGKSPAAPEKMAGTAGQQRRGKLKKIICVDGKTMRSNKREGIKSSRIVSAWSREDGYCLGQTAVDEKSNEITAIPKVLENIEIKGQVVTIDAMGTQTAIVETIRKRRLSMLKLIEIRGRKMSLKRKRFNISFAPAQFIEELMKI